MAPGKGRLCPIRSGRAWAAALALSLLGGCGAAGPKGPPYLVKDIAPGPTDSTPTLLLDMGGTLFFVAYDDQHGAEVWRSDGTEEGTRLVADVNPDRNRRFCLRACLPPLPAGLWPVGRLVYFVDDDGIHGREPWVSDGSEAGTRLVQDISPGGATSMFGDVPTVELRGRALFAAADPRFGPEPWYSDGTSGGTRMLKDIGPVEGSYPGNFTSAGGLAYFRANDGVHGSEPWRTDGTEAGTFLLRDINPGLTSPPVFPAGSFPTGFLGPEGARTVFFLASEETGRNLWKTDGMPPGTERVASLPPDPVPALHVMLGRTLFLSVADPATGLELWSSDGTGPGTRLVKDIHPGSTGSVPRDVTAFGDAVLFAADDGVHGSELWRSDGTAAGTRLVRDLWPGPGLTGAPRGFVRVGALMYFRASTPEAGCSLWMTDGTEQGTSLVRGGEGVCPLGPLVLSGSRLYFVHNAAGSGFELWAMEVR